MRFAHELVERIELESITHDNGERYYKSPTGIMLPSVTTVLSKKMPKEGLDEWRNRVGEEEADRIVKEALTKGTAMHKMLEDYVSGSNDYIGKNMPPTIMLFKQLKPYLDNNLKKVFGIEVNLYSEKLGTAGTSDLLGLWDGIPSVIDYKNARSKRKEEWVQSYFIQSACYAMMANELYNLDIKQFVILIAVNFETPQIFVKNLSDYETKVKEIFNDK